MKTNTKYIRRIAAVGCATAMIGLVGCASPERYDRSAGRYVDDKMITHNVEDALDDQPVFKFPDVTVTTYRGVVQLGGFVASPEQKTAAGEIARQVAGAEEVKNDIHLARLSSIRGNAYIPGRGQTNGTDEATGAPGNDGEKTNVREKSENRQ